MSTDVRIDLKEALLENPQHHARVAKLEGEISSLKDYTTLLRDTFQACHLHQQKVCEGTESMAMLLNSYQAETYGDKDGLLSSSFKRIGRYLNELHSCQEMLSTQLQNAVVELLSLLLSNDFAHLEKLKDNLEASSQEHDQAMAKFSRVSKKKDSEKASFEANADLYAARRKHFETSLDYYAELNSFQLKKKFSLMEPLLTFMHAQMAYFKVGHEILSKDLGKLLNELNSDVQRVHGRYQHEVQVMAEERAEIELEFPILCLPDPDPADPFSEYHVPDTCVTSKAGYLFIRNPKTGFPSKWDRCYFYTKKNQIYMQAPQKSPEMLLNIKGAESSAVDIDDRRYVFQINHAMLKRPVYLLAENSALRDEWIAAINYIGKNKSSNQAGKEESIKQERERIRSWVNREIHKPPVPRATPPNSSLGPAPSTNQGEQKKSPVLMRKLTKQKTSEPVLTSPQRPAPTVASTPPAHLQAPLQPEKVGQAATANVTNSNGSMASYSSSFTVKYLGHTEVQEGKTVGVISETIRKVTMARSMKNVKTAQVVTLSVTHRAITLVNPTAKRSIGQILLKDILRCAVHPENSRLFGIVNRTMDQEKEKTKLICHVLEAQNGMAVCSAVNLAIQTAYMNLQSARTHTRSKSAQPLTKENIELAMQPPIQKASPVPPSVPAATPPQTQSSDYVTSVPPKPEDFNSSESRAHKSASETNLSALGGPRPPGSSVSASSSASSSTDYLNQISTGDGPVELRSAASDDALSENGSSTITSDYITDDTPLSMTAGMGGKPLPQLPTLFESKPQSSGGYISSEQFDPFSVDSPDSDAVSTPKLSTQDAASDSGYFPMPSTLDVQPAQGKENGSHHISPNKTTNKESSGGGGESELMSSGYIVAPADLSQSTVSSSSSNSSHSKSTLASTSAAVAKKSRQLFAKVLPKKSSSSSSVASPSKGSKTKSDTSSREQSKQPSAPQQTLAPPTSSMATQEQLEENDDSDMGDLVDLLDLGEPEEVGNPFSSATNGHHSFTTTTSSSSDFHIRDNSSGYFQDPASSMGVAMQPLPPIIPSTLTSNPFVSSAESATVSSTNSAGYFPSSEAGGFVDFSSASTTSTTMAAQAPPPPFQPFSDDDDLFLPDLPGESDMNSSTGTTAATYGGSIVTLSGGSFSTSHSTK